MAWFKALISDNDVLESTSLKIGQMADIVAQTGVAIDSFEAILKKKESHAKDMVDVGVLCFPDANHSFFQVVLYTSNFPSQKPYICQVVPYKAARMVDVQAHFGISGGL